MIAPSRERRLREVDAEPGMLAPYRTAVLACKGCEMGVLVTRSVACLQDLTGIPLQQIELRQSCQRIKGRIIFEDDIVSPLGETLVLDYTTLGRETRNNANSLCLSGLRISLALLHGFEIGNHFGLGSLGV